MTGCKLLESSYAFELEKAMSMHLPNIMIYINISYVYEVLYSTVTHCLIILSLTLH